MAKNRESPSQLRRQLTTLVGQIVSLLTQSRLSRILEEHKNFDIRRLLTNTDKSFDSILFNACHDTGHLLGAVRCLNMPGNVRDELNQAVQIALGKNSVCINVLIVFLLLTLYKY